MNEPWRLIVEDSDDPVFHLASLEALWRSLDEGPGPDTFVLRRLSPCVLIGASQDAAREVNLAECRRRGLPVLRRPSEGGAIYCDPDCLVFSIVCRRCGKSGEPPDTTLQHWGEVIARSFQRLGAATEACYVRPNDILIGGRKVAGLTMTDWYGIRSFSGAVLIDIDLETMEAVLTPTSEKRERHGTTRIGERVTSLRRCLNPGLRMVDVMEALVAAVGASVPTAFTREPLTARDLETAAELQKRKFGNPAWNRVEEAQEAP